MKSAVNHLITVHEDRLKDLTPKDAEKLTKSAAKIGALVDVKVWKIMESK